MHEAVRRAPPTDDGGAAAWLSALATGVALLPVPLFLYLHKAAADDEVWTWSYLNKRWLVALYLLAVGVFVLLPVAFASWRRRADRPVERPERRTISTSPVSRSATRGLQFVAIVALAWWFAGPPWHLARHHREVESHEQAHLGALQALSKGYVPYIGPASTQYGPGTQMVVHLAIGLTGRFDIVAFREAWAAMNFAAFVLIACVAYAWLDFWPAMAVVVLSAVYSPLSFFGTGGDGTLHGFFGWANGLRYAAPLIVVPALAAAADVDGGRPPIGQRRIVALGIVWGFGAYVAQENLSSTALAAGLFLGLLVATRAMTWNKALRVARDLAIGLAFVTGLVLLYYQRRHAAAIFLENYFAVPRAVASGFQNTWWPSNGSGARTFYAMPALLIVLAVLALWRLPSLTLQPLDAARARFLGFVSVQLMCYEVALLRSDPEHLQNTMIALPFLLVLAAIDLPQWLATTSWRPGTVRVVVIAVALIVLPAGRLLQARAIFGGPAARFVSAREPLPPSTDARIAYARATPRLTDEPLATGYDSLGMREWLDFATDVHTVVGSRKTYVADVGGVWTGPLYFFADLTPAPYPLDRDTMTLNRTLLRRVAAHIGAHPDEYECFIGSELDAPDAQAFLRGHPAARRIDRLLKDRTIHILLAPSTGR